MLTQPYFKKIIIVHYYIIIVIVKKRIAVIGDPFFVISIQITQDLFVWFKS